MQTVADAEVADAIRQMEMEDEAIFAQFDNYEGWDEPRNVAPEAEGFTK